jgi:hypothetical protein
MPEASADKLGLEHLPDPGLPHPPADLSREHVVLGAGERGSSADGRQPLRQHGRVMKEYVTVPGALLADTQALAV